jgi:hypothetical protein
MHNSVKKIVNAKQGKEKKDERKKKNGRRNRDSEGDTEA